MARLSGQHAVLGREPPRSRYLIDCAGAQLRVHARSLATVLRVDGEIDACNADLVARAIRRVSQLKSPLILDLCHLDFLDIPVLRALITLNHENQEAKLHCSVVSGPTLHRLTRVVADHGLPTVDSVPEALQLVADADYARRQFLSRQVRQEEAERNTPATRGIDIPS